MKSIRKVQDKLRRIRDRRNPPILLPFAVPPTLRLAQLSPGPRFASVRPLVLKRWSDIEAFGPQVVVGSSGEMQRLVEQIAAGSLDASSIDRALVILTRFGAKPLNDVARVRLWQAFGVPIFELYLGLDETLLASECEAHEGWHIAAGIEPTTLGSGELILDGAGNSGLRTGLRSSVDKQTCPCGLATPRVLDIHQINSVNERFLAVSA